MDWRTWIKERLDGGATAEIVPPDSIYGSGGIEDSPAGKPFIMIRLGDASPTVVPGISRQLVQVWAHDHPGDYLRIDDILRRVRGDLEGPMAGGVRCEWRGMSFDLVDDGFATATKYATFNISAKSI